MSAQIRRSIRQRQDLEFNRGYSKEQMQASQKRKSFLEKFIIHFDTNLYKTQQERDWAYICKREFNYDVQLRSVGYGLLVGNCVTTWRIFITKKMVWWPLIAISPLVYLYSKPILLQKHNKKLFDMCNLGEEFYLGQKRNQILKQCNEILDTQDF